MRFFMQNKKFTLLILLALPLFCSANNFYAGIGLGHDSTDFYKRLTIEQAGAGEVYDKKDHLAGTGVFGNVFGGYQWQYKKTFLGAELEGDLSTLKYHGYYTDINNQEASYATFTIDKIYGISLLPGYFILDKLGIYGRLGAVRGDFKYSEYKDNSTSNNVGISERKWRNGLKYGIGAILPVYDHLNLRLEYDHIQYQTYTDNTFPLAPNQVRTIKITPNSNQFALSFVYAFA